MNSRRREFAWQPKAEGWRLSKASTTFPNFDGLIADTKVSAKALSDSAASVALSIRDDLRR
jgi:hypothetical protein